LSIAVVAIMAAVAATPIANRLKRILRIDDSYSGAT
jgi:hypothetical protein